MNKKKRDAWIFLVLLLVTACVPNASLVSNPPAYQSGSFNKDEHTVISWQADDLGKITQFEATVTGDGGVSGTMPSRDCVLEHTTAADCRVVSQITMYTTVGLDGEIDVHFEMDGKEFTP